MVYVGHPVAFRERSGARATFSRTEIPPACSRCGIWGLGRASGRALEGSDRKRGEENAYVHNCRFAPQAGSGDSPGAPETGRALSGISVPGRHAVQRGLDADWLRYEGLASAPILAPPPTGC